MRALLLHNEADRLAALHRYRLLDTEPEPSFDRLTRMAARAFAAPISIITLVDDRRKFWKSHHGVEWLQLPLQGSFCAQTILTDEVTSVPDTTADPRFSAHPLVVGVPNVRFYLGAPLKTRDGFRLGTICVLDVKPRPLPEGHLTALLKDLAEEVVELMDGHREKQDFLALTGSLQSASRHLESSRQEIDKWQRRAMQALHAGNMGYWERDAETDRISFSPALEEMLGLDHDRYDGSVAGWLERIHPDDRRKILDKIEEARRTGTNYTLKYRPLTPDGSERWITSAGTYRRDAAGRFAGANGVSWDSTAADLAERKLKMSEELFRVLSDLAPIGIFRTDGEKISSMPTALATVNGVSEQEMLGQRWINIVHPEDRDQLTSAIETNFANGQPDEYQHRLLLSDGAIRWVQARSVPLRDQSGKLIGKVGTVDDITQQRQMLADLTRAKEAAEVANRVKDIFLANVSHELRTPLNGVLGMSELLMDAGLNADQLEMAEIVLESARGLLLVVNDMLDLSRIEAGRLLIQSEPFNLRVCIQQTVSLLMAEARKKSLSLSVRYAANLRDEFLGDSGRIRQILTNYLSNAIKFTSVGEISIEASGMPKGDSFEILLSVRDTGPGIDPACQKILFLPFSQVDSSSTRRNGGAGLGLAICKRLAELMHGEVGLDSEAGRGSTFWFRLPLTCQATKPTDCDVPPQLNEK